MKRTINLSLFLLLLFSQACKKSPLKTEDSTDPDLIESARSFFVSHFQSTAISSSSNNRIKAGKRPYWEAAYTVNSSKGKLVIVPVFYEKDLVVKTNFSGSISMSLNYLTKLIIRKTPSGFYPELVTYFPDSATNASPNSDFSGIIFTESWDGIPLNKYKKSGGTILSEASVTLDNGTSKSVIITDQKQTTQLIQTCTTINGFNYSAGSAGDIYYWSEPGGCFYTFLPESPTFPGTPPQDLSTLFRRPGITPFLTIAPPTNIIASIQDYTKCFSNYGGSDHSYNVSVCVDQPIPGSRAAWALTTAGVGGSSGGANPVDVGHVFLVLTENFGSYSIVRNVGFYPKTQVFPWSSSAQGQLNNDDGHSYNISLTINLDNGQFFNILSYISQGNNSGYMYDLNTNNCTSFAIHALAAGSVIVPATIGSWSDGGFGYDPGDLGEDIRKMSLPPNMTRNATYSDHPNNYNCN